MTDQLVLGTKTENEKNTARMLYAVHGLTFFFSLGLLSIIPVIINYTKMADSAGTIVQSHHHWMVRSFWWYAFWMVLGWILAVTVVGLVLAFPIWGVVWLWKAYRLIRGFLDLNNNKAMPV